MNLITIQTLDDETVARSLMAYPDGNSAMSAFYSTMASSVASDKVLKATCIIMTDEGLIIRTEHWEREE